MPEGYDVFLSHDATDTAAVEAIAVRLRDEAGLRPFLAKWHLAPGESWTPALEQSATVAVFVGAQGRGGRDDRESQLALVLAEERGKRIIPVLLPGARTEDIGAFLRLRAFADLGDDRGFERLVAGITGRRPRASAAAPEPDEPPTARSAWARAWAWITSLLGR